MTMQDPSQFSKSIARSHSNHPLVQKPVYSLQTHDCLFIIGRHSVSGHLLVVH